MRSIFLVILSLLFVGGGFAIYFWLQPPHRSTAGRQIVAAPPIAAELDDANIGNIHNSFGVYIKKPDKNGNLASEYFADEAKPRRNGQIDVKNPKANFYLERWASTGNRWDRWCVLREPSNQARP